MGVAFESASRDGGGRDGRTSAKDKKKVVCILEYTKSVYFCSSIYLIGMGVETVETDFTRCGISNTSAMHIHHTECMIS